MDFWHSWNGMVQVRIRSADIPGFLSASDALGIALYDVAVEDELSLRLCVKRQNVRIIIKLCHQRGEECEILSRMGVFWKFKRMLKRPVLTWGLCLLMILGLFIPTRVYFVKVEGNTIIPTRKILEEAASCGITFGASRRAVRSEKMKNNLLEAIPELQWAGVNTYGCVATITVKERQPPQTTDSGRRVSSIVAVRDGVILSCTVSSGNGICRVGQAVKAGEILVSGYTDCGLSIRATRAQAEIFASTSRQLMAVMPADWSTRLKKTGEEKKYALIFGKKRINLYFDSGISDASCGRMYEENYMVLPGGFQLPLALVTEVWTYYENTDVLLAEDIALQDLQRFAAAYLSERMIAGQILSKEESCYLDNGRYCLRGQYSCQEMIGQEQSEEIVKPYGENDGTDRKCGTG